MPLSQADYESVIKVYDRHQQPFWSLVTQVANLAQDNLTNEMSDLINTNKSFLLPFIDDYLTCLQVKAGLAHNKLEVKDIKSSDLLFVFKRFNLLAANTSSVAVVEPTQSVVTVRQVNI